MNLKIKTGTVGYYNKILVSDEKFSLEKNEKTNSVFAKPEEETTTKKDSKVVQKLTTIHKVVTQKPTITHEEERAAWFSFSLVALLVGLYFDEQKFCVLQYTRSHAIPDIVYVPIELVITILCTAVSKILYDS